jgi:hypothetical protein
MMEQQISFDARRYVQQKALRILHKNGGTKLSVETLVQLARTGLRLIPPIDLQM